MRWEERYEPAQCSEVPVAARFSACTLHTKGLTGKSVVILTSTPNIHYREGRQGRVKGVDETCRQVRNRRH